MSNFNNSIEISGDVFKELVSNGRIADSSNNSDAAFFVGVAANALPDSFPIEWHVRALKMGIVPTRDSFHIMQDVSWAIIEAQREELAYV
ncbi:MAG TPA: hypothetical protein VJC09_02725 [Candidatus Saccharimonadales bacterium]|nr:hypothetical protein [Candidatus Saccharimonadales bacterium]